MCEEAPLSRIHSFSRTELVEAAAMKAQLHVCGLDEDDGRKEACFVVVNAGSRCFLGCLEEIGEMR